MTKATMGFRIFVLVVSVVMLGWNLQVGIHNYMTVPRQITSTHNIHWLKSDYNDLFYVGQRGIYFARGGTSRSDSDILLTPRTEVYKGAGFTGFSVTSYEIKDDNLVVAWERKFSDELLMRIGIATVLSCVIFLAYDSLRSGKWASAVLDHLGSQDNNKDMGT